MSNKETAEPVIEFRGKAFGCPQVAARGKDNELFKLWCIGSAELLRQIGVDMDETSTFEMLKASLIVANDALKIAITTTIDFDEIKRSQERGG